MMESYLSSFIVVISGMLLSVIAWAFTTQSRVSVLETKDIDLKKLIEVQFTAVNTRLDRIDKSLNGHLFKD